MRRSHREDKLSKIYDAEILPIWSERFGRLLLRSVELPPKAMVLDVGCGTGYPALDLLGRMDADGRIIAIDPSSPMLDQARLKAGRLSGKRIFFRSEGLAPRLSFTDDVYDLVVCNAGLTEVAEPELAVAEFARVARPSGQVAVALPVLGTYGEFFDLFRDVLVELGRDDALARLDLYLQRFPALARVESWFEQAGLVDRQSEWSSYTLLFRSSREFFFSALVEYGPLPAWKAVAGRGAELQEAFWRVKEAIDVYFGGGPFAVTVNAACVRGRKLDAAALAARQESEEGADTGPVPKEHQLTTGEYDLIASGSLEGLDDDEAIDEPIL